MSDEAKLCSACGKAPAATANRGLVAQATMAGLCYPCWKKNRGPSRRAGARASQCLGGSLAQALAAIEEEVIGELTSEARAFIADTEQFVGRVYARLEEVRRRRVDLGQMLARIEKRATEAAAELRREVKRVQGARRATHDEMQRLPKSAAERAAERAADEDARETQEETA